MPRRYLLFRCWLIGCIFVACNTQPTPSDSLKDALACFDTIQNETRTKAWWFHGETQTTREGITADLESLKHAGLGGVVYYDQSHGKAEHALEGFSPQWWSMLRFAAEEAERLGLTFEVHISNGYVAGGKHIGPSQGMKRLVATERWFEGPGVVEETLEAPVSSFFKDVVVLAFPAPEGMGLTSDNQERRSWSNVRALKTDPMFSPDETQLTVIPVQAEPVYVYLEFKTPFTARSIQYEVRPRGKATTSATNVPAPPQATFVGTGYRILPDLGQLEVSMDGVRYERVCDLKPIYRAHERWRQKTISFPAVTGRFFRLKLHDWWEKDGSKPLEMQLGNIRLNGAAKVDQWEEKAGLFSEYIESDHTPEYAEAEVIDPARVVDLTQRMDTNGVLRWNVPEGKWMVMRFAYVPTGASTKHGRRNLMGLEVDRMSSQAAQYHWEQYVGLLLDSLNRSKSGKLSGVAMDSHEAGAQNWTDGFMADFARRRGYHPMTFLPAMWGYVVQDVSASNGFLFDVRRNIADMISENFYGTMDRLCRENGLMFTAQAIGNALCIVGDPIQAKSFVGKPQGEFWPIHPDGNYDIKESASAAHLYGKPIASAEAFTDAKHYHTLPEFKSLADYAYAFGINEFVVCAVPFQPQTDAFPGSTGGGRHYSISRSNSWWSYSKPFWDYQARNAHILRLGMPVIDLCVYLGENAPVKILTHRLPEIPGGYDFDACSSHALMTRMTADPNGIKLPDGMRYRMLVLPRNGEITFEALQKIEILLRSGAQVYGSKPRVSQSLRDRVQAEAYQQLADALWGKRASDTGSNRVGKGFLQWGIPLEQALLNAGIKPDVRMQHSNTKKSRIYYTHRRLKDADVYFLDNHSDTDVTDVFTFPVKGAYAQLWNTVTGQRFSIPLTQRLDSDVSMPLMLHARESYFVVLTDDAESLPEVQWLTNKTEVRNLNADWHTNFSSKWGGPGEIVLDSLRDWTQHPMPSVAFYSGTAIYRKTFDWSADRDPVWLQLTLLNSVARVFMNGRDAGVLWCAPWLLDVQPFLHAGKNELEIHVANTWINRMIADAALPASERITDAYPPIMQPNDAVQPSGLISARLIQ